MSTTTNRAAWAIRLLATTTMRPFTAHDHAVFAGCEFPDPLIGESPEHILILDGHQLEVMGFDERSDSECFVLFPIARA